jgi:hypothetical protein
MSPGKPSQNAERSAPLHRLLPLAAARGESFAGHGPRLPEVQTDPDYPEPLAADLIGGEQARPVDESAVVRRLVLRVEVAPIALSVTPEEPG